MGAAVFNSVRLLTTPWGNHLELDMNLTSTVLSKQLIQLAFRESGR